ncbi:hypothetical protein ACFL20_03240 [Spirochaetota bacterium]
MIIETTININTSVLNDIILASDKRGKSKSETIVMLLKMVMKDNGIKAKINKSVKYQVKEEKDNWHKLHIYLGENDYEYFLDLRKLLKMSVSNIVAYAVKKFLHCLLKNNITDNYQFTNYILTKNTIDGVIFWQLFWGVPNKIEELLKYSKL